MSIFYVKNEQIDADRAFIIGEDVKHIRDVLRYKINDEVNICDEDGKKYIARITDFFKDEINLEILEKYETTSESSINVTLFQGMPKADKLEFIIQKCTELGIKEIVPVMTERAVVKLDEKSIPRKVERWNKIALEASKQSGRQKVPTIKNPINIKNLVENLSKYDILILPYECEKNVTIKEVLKDLNGECKNIGIFIGPVGGFSEEEIMQLDADNVKKVTLGPRILRTETAGIATLAMVMYELEL